jgi:hypothetical protein
MKSQRRQKQLQAKRAAKAKRIERRGGQSVYARKLRGEYPSGSPYSPGRGWEGLEPVRHVNAGGYLHLGRGR